MSAVSSSSIGQAEPIWILISSAVRSPMARENSFLTYCMHGVVELVAGDADRLGGDDAAERDDGDLGGAAADVDDHVAATARGRAGRRRWPRPSAPR